MYRSNQHCRVVLAGESPRNLQHEVASWGYDVRLAGTVGELTQLVSAFDAKVILLDSRLGSADGLAVYRSIQSRGVRCSVVFLSAETTIDTAVRAIKMGACDFITPPFDKQRLRRALELANEDWAARLENGSAQTHASRLIGRSEAMRLIDELIGEVAPTEANVMILGESGTGKELVAHELHARSLRSKCNFVPVNMAAIPDGLVESILFGHQKGSFTGAHTAQIGVCQQAHNGTLFLDEIGEMSQNSQAKLLRFVQEQTIHRVGASHPESVDVRIVSATNRDPALMLDDKSFREDLFFRLNVVPIRIPPLRERPDDVEILANEFLRRSAKKNHKQIAGFSSAFLQMMAEFHWPGNVRQLENVVERLVIFARNGVIDEQLLHKEIAGEKQRRNGNGSNSNVPSPPALPAEPSLDGDLDELSWADQVERNLIIEALEKTSGNVVRAARLLGLGQATVYRKIKRYRIPRERAVIGSNGAPN